MKKINSILISFNSIFISIYFVILNVSKSNEIDFFNSINNIVNDLGRVGLELNISINLLSLSLLITLLVVPFTLLFVKSEIINMKIEEYFYYGIKLIIFVNFSIITIIYLLRLFGFNRSFLIINFLIFPLIYLTFYLFNHFLYKTLKPKYKLFSTFGLIILFIVFLLVNRPQETTFVELSNVNESEVQFANVNEDVNDANNFCTVWEGSDNFSECLYNFQIEVTKPNSLVISNAINFDSKLYIVYKEGFIKVFKNNELSDFLSISEKVFRPEKQEMGLLGLAFHPSESYFVITYTNNEPALVVEKFLIKEDIAEFESSEVVYKIPFNGTDHISGNIIWSNFYRDFILSVGDMASNSSAILNTDPLNTTSVKGKLLLLNGNVQINSPLIATINNHKPLNNIVAYGLRNPWQVVEFDNKLFIPDVGHANYEELNIIDLNNEFKNNIYTSFSLGWPLFEGPFYSKELNEAYGGSEVASINVENITNLYLWESENTNKADKYLSDISKIPNVFYKHGQFNNGYRAAIIGGGVIEDIESKYYKMYFFADFLSKELFMYDYENDQLFILELPLIVEGFITSVKISPYEKNQLVVTTGAGEIVFVNLPK